ncbi:uncharacterized protein J7T54_007982 [Emericellopsis cladophorae]|uniref:Uncharacterized protein n=1 Tax=Emericellopsis cladophorae TaxID=2686198 RepID=A0A9P9Y783_9HYPO|nr:uncharacterized protein J7T54_007982 [Emericellopsis cladophorae]KAI6784888.1 hypothetical protein J7T54_007982 [Emericellopsis cladophorae]
MARARKTAAKQPPTPAKGSSSTSDTDVPKIRKARSINWASRVIAVALLAPIVVVARHALRVPQDSLNSFAGRYPLKTTYTGFEPVDGFLAKLVSAFSYILAGDEPNTKAQLMYFAPLLGVTLMLWTIEGWRRGNRTSLYGIAMQIFGVGLVAPIYFILSILSDRGDALEIVVPPQIAKSAFPATIISFAIPTFLMLVPTSDVELRQNIIASWQPSPLTLAVLTTFLGVVIKQASSGTAPTNPMAKTTQESAAPVVNPLPTLKFVYSLAFTLAFACHVVILGYIVTEPELSLSGVFCNLPAPFDVWDLENPVKAMGIFMRYDLLLLTVSILVFLAYNAYDLVHLGCVGSSEAINAVAYTAVGQVLVGPAASYVGFWSWRESALARKRLSVEV